MKSEVLLKFNTQDPRWWPFWDGEFHLTLSLNGYSWPTQRSEIKWSSWVTNWITWIESLVMNWSYNGITPINGLINWRYNGRTLEKMRLHWDEQIHLVLEICSPWDWRCQFSTLWSLGREWFWNQWFLCIPEKWGESSNIPNYNPWKLSWNLKKWWFPSSEFHVKLQEFFWPKVSISTWTWRMSIPTISAGKGPISRCRPEEATEKKNTKHLNGCNGGWMTPFFGGAVFHGFYRGQSPF